MSVSPPPPAGPSPSTPSRLGWYVAGGVLVLVLAIGGAVFALTGGDATSVQEVADQAVEAAEDLDVDAGIDLLCRAPSDTQRRELADVIAEGQEESGTDEPGLEGKELDAVVLVEEVDGRSCISGFHQGETVGEDGD